MEWARVRVKKKAGAGELVFVMEATLWYHLDCALFLHSESLRICVVNPRYVHAFRRAMGYENKTDITDAEVLARFGEVRHSNEWRPLSVH
ncbi:transposase, partial [bacterium]|nr:transposase [bacterium]